MKAKIAEAPSLLAADETDNNIIVDSAAAADAAQTQAEEQEQDYGDGDGDMECAGYDED